MEVMDFAVYRTAHGVFKEVIPGEFTAFIFPSDAPCDALIQQISNGIIYHPSDALHIFHWNRVFEVIRDRKYRQGQLLGVLNGDITGSLVLDECHYCSKHFEKDGDRCRRCSKELSGRYREAPYEVDRLLNYLDRNRWDRMNAVLLHQDEVFVRMRSKDIADGRLRSRGDNQQGYNPLSLTFSRDIIRRNELIFNAEMAERTGRMQALKFKDE
jgi:hypothetical protein